MKSTKKYFWSQKHPLKVMLILIKNFRPSWPTNFCHWKKQLAFLKLHFSRLLISFSNISIKKWKIFSVKLFKLYNKEKRRKLNISTIIFQFRQFAAYIFIGSFWVMRPKFWPLATRVPDRGQSITDAIAYEDSANHVWSVCAGHKTLQQTNMNIPNLQYACQ